MSGEVRTRHLRGEEIEEGESDPLLARSVAPPGPLARHVFAAMGFFGFANVYAMRVNLSVAIVAMVNNTAINNNIPVDNNTCPVMYNTSDTNSDTDGPFEWGGREQGWLLGAFFYGYVLTQIPGGRLAELWGGKTLYGTGVLITAVFTLLTPVAANTSIYLLVLVRVLEGLGEGVTFPAMHAMMAVWVPPGERGRLAGLVYSGSQAGTVLSLPLSGLLCDKYGWESVFYVFGTLGLIWYIGWVYLVFNSPREHPRISRIERQFIEDSLGLKSQPKTNRKVPWVAILTSGPVWALLATHVAQNYGFYTLLTELPTYMKNVLHFNIRDNSVISALPYLMMLITGISVPRLADWLVGNNTISITTSRKLFNSLALFLPALFLVLAAYSGCDYTLTIALLCLAVGSNGAHYAGLMCVHLDLANKYAGTLLGFTNAAANIMGFVAPTVTGYIIDGHSDLDHWRLVFFIAAMVYIVGNTIFLVFGTSKEQSWNRDEEDIIEEEDDLIDREEW